MSESMPQTTLGTAIAIWVKTKLKKGNKQNK
jgi:hypothetical protein